MPLRWKLCLGLAAGRERKVYLGFGLEGSCESNIISARVQEKVLDILRRTAMMA